MTSKTIVACSRIPVTGGVRRSLPFPGGMSKRVEVVAIVAAAAVAAAGVVVGITLQTRTTPHQPQARSRARRRVPTNLPEPWGPPIEQAFEDWPKGSIDAMQRIGLQYPKRRPVVAALPRASRCSGPGIRATRRPRSSARRSSAATRSSEVWADNLLHPRTSSPRRRLPDLPADAAEPRCSSRARGCRRRGTRSRPSASTSGRRAAARTTTRRRSPPPSGRFDEDNLDAGVLAPRAAHAALSAQPVRALLPRAAARLDGTARRVAQAVQGGASRSAATTGLGKSAGEFVARATPAGPGDRQDEPRPMRRPSDAAATVPAPPVKASGVGERGGGAEERGSTMRRRGRLLRGGSRSRSSSDAELDASRESPPPSTQPEPERRGRGAVAGARAHRPTRSSSS